MSKLGQVVEAVEKHSRFVLDQVKRARSDEKFGRELSQRWQKTKADIPISRAPSGYPKSMSRVRLRATYSARDCRVSSHS